MTDAEFNKPALGVKPRIPLDRASGGTIEHSGHDRSEAEAGLPLECVA